MRRAVVILSDGDDNQSRVTREEAIAMAQRAEVVIYAISTNGSGYKERGDKVLQHMADATGGTAFFPLKAADVANAFAEIEDELRSQYAIAYRPADFLRNGHYRSIQILAENHKKLKVRARKGYFAQAVEKLQNLFTAEARRETFTFFPVFPLRTCVPSVVKRFYPRLSSLKTCRAHSRKVSNTPQPWQAIASNTGSSRRMSSLRRKSTGSTLGRSRLFSCST